MAPRAGGSTHDAPPPYLSSNVDAHPRVASPSSLLDSA
eukprot:CAMPEP_0115859198 /NCGR_PEP_ID=MMETSP0287-20121206/16491_1 /TAXON_ID=412157 /ORGANISM="Chrysochromulina rotalis, Strain UIO044" /LENGTH=37 /DNA_ID= /DNA_START= /DNA_END= /DNA_ORIENTATION=